MTTNRMRHQFTTLMKVAVVGGASLACSYAEGEMTAEAAQRVLTDALVEQCQYPSYLFEAVENDNRSIVELLIKAGADINTKDAEGATPLMRAAKLGKNQCVELLVGDDVSQWGTTNPDGMTAADLAWKSGNQKTALLIALCIKKRAFEKLTARGIESEQYSSALLAAAASGDAETLKLLLIAGVDVNSADAEGETALVKAAANGRVECLKLLLNEEDIDVAKAKNGITPLIAAIVASEAESVDVLLSDSRVDVNQAMPEGNMTPLHFAAYKGNLVILERLLSEKGIIKDCLTNEGHTVMHSAVEGNNKEGMRFLMERIPELLNKQMTNGSTPLHLAVLTDHDEIVEELLASPDIEVDKRVIDTCREIAGGKSYELVWAYMKENASRVLETMSIDQSQYNSMLFKSMDSGDKFVFDLLLHAGADINGVDATGTPLLCKAAELEDTHYIRALLERPTVDLSCTNSHKQTALHVAAAADRIEQLSLLMQTKKLNTNAQDENGNTPLHLAVEVKSFRALELLLDDSSAPFFVRNAAGCNPVEVAKRLGEYEIMRAIFYRARKHANKLLKQKGIDMVEYDVALLDLAGEGDYDTVELLLYAGADANAADQDGNTPFLRAAQRGKIGVLMLLKNPLFSCHPWAYTRTRRNALHLAVSAGMVSSVEYLVKNHPELMKQPDISGAIPYAAACAENRPECRKLIQTAMIQELRAELTARGVEEPVLNVALCEAASDNDLVKMELCLHGGADVNGLVLNRTVLDYAIEKCHVDAVKLLLQHPDINVDNTSEGNTTALHAAVNADCVEIIQLLLARNDVDVNKCDDAGNTPLALAVEGEKNKCVHALLESSRVDLKTHNHEGEAPIHMAARKGKAEYVKLFIRKDAKQLNYTDKSGRTPLYVAAKYGCPKVVSELLGYKHVRVGATAIDGLTPLHVAVLNNHPYCLELMLNSRKFDANALAKYNRLRNCTPLYIAAHKGHVKCVKLLMPVSIDLVQPLVAANNAVRSNGSPEHAACASALSDFSNNRGNKGKVNK